MDVVVDPSTDDDRAFVLHAVAPGSTAPGVARVARPTAAVPPTWTVELTFEGQPDDAVADALISATRELVATHGGGELHWWRPNLHAGDTAQAVGLGFTVGRDLLQMRVPLPRPDPIVWPAGIREDRFVVGRDEAAWLALNNAAFAGHPEQGNWDLATLQGREAEPWFDPAGFVLAFDEHGLAGACWTKIHPSTETEPEQLGEIYVICTAPDRAGKGLGRALTLAGLAHMAPTCPVGMLYVDAANERAVGLYTSLGFTEHQRDRAFVSEVAAR